MRIRLVSTQKKKVYAFEMGTEEALTQYSCDPEHGDTPHGSRIEQCKRWAEK